MKSFLASFFISILLISSGMLTAVIDVCCLNEEITISENQDCCTGHTHPKPKSCCEVAKPEDLCSVDSHESCEFDFWYYYTPKFIEEDANKLTSSIFTQTFPLKIERMSIATQAVADIPQNNYQNHPPPLPGRHVLEQHCTWII